MKAVIGALCALSVAGTLATPAPLMAQTQAPAAAASTATTLPTFKHETIKHVPIKHVAIKHVAQSHTGAAGQSGATASAAGAAQGDAKDLTGPKAGDYVPKSGTQGKP